MAFRLVRCGVRDLEVSSDGLLIFDFLFLARKRLATVLACVSW